MCQNLVFCLCKRNKSRCAGNTCCSNTGIHYVGELSENTPFYCTLEQMTNGQLQWEPLENPFDMVLLGPPKNRRCYPIYSGKARFTEELKKRFPGEEKAIDDFTRLSLVCIN